MDPTVSYIQKASMEYVIIQLQLSPVYALKKSQAKTHVCSKNGIAVREDRCPTFEEILVSFSQYGKMLVKVSGSQPARMR